MPFEPGNQWGKIGGAAKRRKAKEWDYMSARITGEATTHCINLLEKLASGEELEKAETAFLDEYKSLLEYFKPKLARRELTGKDGGDLNINLIKFDNNNTSV